MMTNVYLLALLVVLNGHAQLAHPLALRAEQREEVWFLDDEHDEHLVKITRTISGTYVEHASHDVGDRTRHTGYSFFYLSDFRSGFYYVGNTFLKAAFRARVDPGSMKRSAGEDFGDCSILRDATFKPVDGGKILGYPVFQIETIEKEELRTIWVAPDLDCFPLRRQVMIDDIVRMAVETTNLEILPEGASVSLPSAVRLVSPREYCNIYKLAFGIGFASEESCANLERQHGQYAPKPEIPKN